MDFSMAIIRALQVESNEKSRVKVVLATGTHHRLTLYRKSPEGRYTQDWTEEYPSAVGGMEIEAGAGSIVYQRMVSPAIADPLERYGVILPDGKVDWGTETDRVVDFGPVGVATRRGVNRPAASISAKRGRVFAPHGEEVVGGAVSDASTTSGD